VSSAPEFDYIAKLMSPFMKTYLDGLKAHDGLAAPVVVELDPTTKCEFSCPECISMGLLNQGELSARHLYRVLSDLAGGGTRGVIFIGGGEPLDHSAMPQPLVEAKRLGLSVGLTTNGYRIDKFYSVISQNVDWTRVSLDAGSAAMYRVFRPSRHSDAFDLVLQGLERLGSSNERIGTLGTSFLLIYRRLGARVITNAHEICKAALISRDLGCDYFEVKPAVDDAHELIEWPQNLRESIIDQLAAVGELSSPTFRVIWPESIDHMLRGRLDQPKSYRTCPTLELRTVLTPSGLYPCPYKRGDDGLSLPLPVGSFATFWQSAQRKEWTGRVDPSTDCSHFCIRHGLNEALVGYLESGDVPPSGEKAARWRGKTSDVFL
jgi:pyruvate-formate lyase-activating enzyme